MENSEENVLSPEGEENLASESYETNDEIEFEKLECADAGPYSSEPLADDEWLREYF